MSQSLTLVLYFLCALLLSGGSLYLFLRERDSITVRWFIGVCVSLLIWLATLFLFLRSTDSHFILWVGRVNFAAISLAVYLGWRFVNSVARKPASPWDWPLLALSILFAGLSAFTPLIDRAELIGAGTASGRHETIYGALFPLYVLHVVGMLLASIVTAFQGSRRLTRHPHRRDQLLLLGWGILATSAVGLITNVLLPYVWGNFAWIDLGPLSTLLFLFAVAYAVVRHQLFDIRIFLRKTLILGLVFSLLLAAYSAMALILTDRFASTESSGVTRFGVLVLAFSFDPIRRFLEKKIDSLLFTKKRFR